MVALQKLLSGLEDQRALWPRIRAFQGSESRGQQREGETSKPLPPVTEVGMEDHLEPAADQDQGTGAIAISATSDRPGAPLQPGEAEQGSPDVRRGAGKASETRTSVLGAQPTADQGKPEPDAEGDPLGMPQPRGQEEQPATGEERAAKPPQRVQGCSGGRGRLDLPLAGEPPSKGRQLAEGGRSTKEGAGRRRRNWGLTPGMGRRPAEQLPEGDPGERPPPEPLA